MSNWLKKAKKLGKKAVEASVEAGGSMVDSARAATTEAVEKIEEMSETKYSLIIPENENQEGVMESEIQFEEVQKFLSEFGITLKEKE